MDNTLQLLYKKNYQLLVNVGRSLHLPDDEIQDIIQQLFLELAEKKIDFSLINNPDGYIVTSFKRKIIDHYRKQKSTPFSVFNPSGDLAEPENIEDIIQRDEERKMQMELLYKHFSRLPKRSKKVLFLKYFHRLSNEEIAKKTGLSVQSIYNNLSEGIKALRVAFKKRDK